jgi:hypothetical protein
MRLAPLTGLFGKNGTGKSAILQWLRQQTPSAIYLSPFRAPLSNLALGEFAKSIPHDNGQPEMPLINEAMRKLGLIYEAKELQTPSTGALQALPLLQACYTASPDSLILIENPDILLHPTSQAELADLFIEAVTKRNVQIIFESHSEYLLHRLQRRIAEEQIANEAVALYFCEIGEDGASKLMTLQVNEYGSICNWPRDFFGNEITDLCAMVDAEMKRKRKARKPVAQEVLA